MCAFPKCYCFLKDGKEMNVFTQPPTAALIIFPDAPDGGKKLLFYNSFGWAIIYRPMGFIYFCYYSFSSLQTINLNNMILEINIIYMTDEMKYMGYLLNTLFAWHFIIFSKEQKKHVRGEKEISALIITLE